MCDLCNLVNQKRNPLKNIRFGIFMYEPECADPECAMPMIILREHRAELTAIEQVEFEIILEEHFPGLKARGIGMRSIKDHWHEHLVLKD